MSDFLTSVKVKFYTIKFYTESLLKCKITVGNLPIMKNQARVDNKENHIVVFFFLN